MPSPSAGSLAHLPACRTSIRLQQTFGGEHDLSSVRAHLDSPAAAAARELGARAYTRGDAIAFAGPPDLRLAAHEAAHVVQQRAGVALDGGVGRPDDRHERQARAAADLAVRGQSAARLLARGSARHGGAGVSAPQVQCDSFTSVGQDSETVVNEPGSLQRHADKVDLARAEELYYQLARNAGDETGVFADNASVEDLRVYLRANPNLTWPERGSHSQNVRFLQGWDRARHQLPHVPMRLDQKLDGIVRFVGDMNPLYYTGQTPPPVTIEWTRNAANNFWLSYYGHGVLHNQWEMVRPSGQVQRLRPADGYVQTTAFSPSLDDAGSYWPRVTIRMGRGGPNSELTWVGAPITALAITREQFATSEYRKAVTEKDAEGNDPGFRLDASGMPVRLTNARPLGFQDQVRFNSVRIGALKK